MSLRSLFQHACLSAVPCFSAGKTERKEANEKNEKRKLRGEKACHLKAKKKRTEDEIKCLHKSADDQAKKAEGPNEMMLLT